MQYILLIVIFILLFSAIVAMFFFSYLAKKYYERARDKKLEHIKASSPYRGKKPLSVKSNKNDFRVKDKIAEKRKLEERLQEKEQEKEYVTFYDPEEKGLAAAKKDDLQIVGVAKPVGFWSRLIRNQKLGFMIALAGLQNKPSSKGYWVNLIKAQAISQGKEQSKGR